MNTARKTTPPTRDEVMEAIATLGAGIDARQQAATAAVRADIGRLEQRMGGFEQRMDRFEETQKRFEQRMDRFEETMNTNHLDLNAKLNLILAKLG